MKTNGTDVNSFLTSKKSTGLGIDKVSAGASISMMMMMMVPRVFGIDKSISQNKLAKHV